jgi:hypothetical protein
MKKMLKMRMVRHVSVAQLASVVLVYWMTAHSYVMSNPREGGGGNGGGAYIHASDVMPVYGEKSAELNQLDHYLDLVLPEFTIFNLSAYMDDLNKCSGSAAVAQCHQAVSKLHSNASALWTPTYNITQHRYHHLPDCSYTFTFFGAQADISDGAGQGSILNYLSFHIDIQQVCLGNVSTYTHPALGGSTFDIFGYSESAIAACTSKDYFNGTYRITCKLPHFAEEVAPHCIYLTVNLEHEHFDSFSLVLQAWSDFYSNVRQVLLNNVTFCTDKLLSAGMNKVITPPKVSSPLDSYSIRESSVLVHYADSSLRTNRSSVVSLYSGIWVREGVDDSDFDWWATCGLTFIDTIESCSKAEQVDPTKCSLAWGASNVGSLNRSLATEMLKPTLSYGRFKSLSMATNRRGCFNTIGDYKRSLKRFFPLDAGAALISESTTLPRIFTFRPLKQDLVHGQMSTPSSPVINPQAVDVMSDVIWSVPGFRHPHRLRNHIGDDTNNHPGLLYKFIGASHMRYFFMGVLEALYGMGSIAQFNRKVTNSNFHQFNFTTTHYIPDLIEEAKAFCSEVNRTHHGVLIMQTGDWDLSVNVGRVVRDKRFAPALASFIGDLVEGRYHCPYVEHVIFITAMPHPTCMQDLGEFCGDERCYRTNPSISALNEYLLNTLLALRPATGSPTHETNKRFSIVDAFGIALPRILLNENIEIGCTNHFSCGVEMRKRKTEMIHGASGSAVLQAILHALID